MKTIENLLVNGAAQIGVNLSKDAVEKFILYFNELNRWNQKTNITSLNTDSDIVVNLFIDSLAGSLALDLRTKSSIVDIGSGGGFPGIPIKIAYPDVSMTLIEPKIKKTSFLHHLIGLLSLDDVLVKKHTIQEYEGMESKTPTYDYVMFKAIKPEDLFPSVLSLLHPETRVCIYRSRSIGPEKFHFNMQLDREISYQLPYGYGQRVLTVLRPAVKDGQS